MDDKKLSKSKPPEKPYAGFPLRPHAKGKWTKKIAGRSFYFGKWAEPELALAEYEAHISKPRPVVVVVETPKSASVMTIADAADLFLEAKASAVTEGTIVQRTFDDYLKSAQRFVTQLGSARAVATLTPSDFGTYRHWLVNEKTYGIVTVGNEIVRIRVMITWVFNTYFPNERPQFGPSFDRASQKSLRRHKAEQKSKLLKPATIHAVLDEAGVHFKAMVLLGINCGYGPTDCARLPLSIATNAVRTGWLRFMRTKTYINRESALWPETIDALNDSIARRTTPIEAAKTLCFVTVKGESFDPLGTGQAGQIQRRWASAKASSQIEDGSFYCLRHTFNTIARQTGDQGAVKIVMGHADGTISESYDHDVDETHIIDPERLIRVSKKVRDWLGFPTRQNFNAGAISPVTSDCVPTVKTRSRIKT